MTRSRAWSRLYLVPGMGHCAGGPETLDSFDALGAMVRWVEQGSRAGKPHRDRTFVPRPQPPALRLSAARALQRKGQ